MSHSPLPWNLTNSVWSNLGRKVIDLDSAETSPPRRDDLFLIVEAVNQHYELLDTLARFQQDSEQYKMGQEDKYASIIKTCEDLISLTEPKSLSDIVFGMKTLLKKIYEKEECGPDNELPRPYDEVKAERDKYKDIVDKVAEIVIRSDTTGNDDWQDITVLLTEQGYELIFTGDQ